MNTMEAAIIRFILVYLACACVGFATGAEEFICEEVVFDPDENFLADLYEGNDAAIHYDQMMEMHNLSAFSCGSLLIFLKIPEEGVFGVSETFVFDKKSGRLIGGTLE